MGKYESKQTKKRAKRASGGIILAVVLAVFLAALLMMFVVPQILYKLGANEDDIAAEEPPSSEEALEPQPTTEPFLLSSPVSFPLSLEDGKLEITGAFQFDGINPDSSNQEGSELASITLTNTSDTYLEKADLSMYTDDGTLLTFTVTDLPAGKSAMAFSLENASSVADAAYGDVTCQAEFDESASLMEDQITLSVAGTHVTLRNNTDTELTDLVVYCRSSLGDQYFGGITYTYTVNNLPAYGTAELEAEDCILGLAEVVRIAMDHT